ncbi:ABC transporter ATP-binding protein [Desulfovibrio sulfodismutans]|uniref:ABC transporter ATP-binding protein n=2 Tax=Desulfolutivibrio sulfodismutans TaxID=63561 RepID=A0A7K3NP47_9BACT|nr:ABC transporter ATP-binding protein [Desulfolutivibrio sulfodismutans]NDY57950.1 ABC transporter ATP-binding protein [Desulfolutivibrio sulfodismutans]QLA14620.1 ATP-binding cassette domain-containing protein [Desulfolutivibrio sulfodismutans DSM 3696]
MIMVEKLCKDYPISHGRKMVLQDVSFTLRKGQKLGILGCNGAGKSTLIRLLGGVEKPTSGTVTSQMSVSWPLAFQGGIVGNLSGFDNLRFICRIYQVDFETAVAQVQDFSELGNYLYEPVKTYSSGMRARLAFAISMTVDFDCYLIDEISAVGDKRFNERFKKQLGDKTAQRSVIMVSHFYGVIKEYCELAAVLNSGILTLFDDVTDAIKYYEQVLLGKKITF